MDEVRSRIEKLTRLVSQVENSEVWREVTEEIRSLVQELDDNWQALAEGKFEVARTRKIGLMSVLGIIGEWKEELEGLEQQLFEEENPDKVQSGDYDGETMIEGEV